MSDPIRFDSVVAVSPRFARSVSLARDAGRLDATDGYVLTPTGREILRRLADAMAGATSTRAWSITGPYGTGKSAFALLAAQALAGDDRPREAARAYLTSAAAELAARFFGPGGALPREKGRLCPVLVTGSRQPLARSLASALAEALRGFVTRRKPNVLERLEAFLGEADAPGTRVVELFQDANEYLSRFGAEAAGILLVVDELGKFLEYGATNPEQGDIFVLQELAEAATRSERPFLFLTVLHQSLDRYADHLSAGRRAEWAKVQGRFEDVAFEERTEQLVRLLGHAIRQAGDDAGLRLLRKQAKAVVKEVTALGMRIGSMGEAEQEECLAACYPLHPLTAVALGPLFRQLAQNERSLFAFLGSSEPFGFQEFLRERAVKDGPYRLDRLYDYVMASLGPALFAHHRGKLWAEVQSALERLHDSTPLEVMLAKTIGLLQALGPATGLAASVGMLQAALEGAAGEGEVDAALQVLAARSVVVFRRHTGGFALWEGSDVDIDDRLQAARQAVERDMGLAAFLAREVPPQPMIARRHYFQTGTLRYFDVAYCDVNTLDADLFRSQLSGHADDADGRVVLFLPRDPDGREAMRAAAGMHKDGPVVFALPRDVFDLRELCHELVCLRWAEGHTPELESDRTARREVRARLVAAEQALHEHLGWLFSPANEHCAWYYRGEQVRLGGHRRLNDLVSRAADEAYPSTPRWRNELVNRRALSSAAAAARRNLIEAMFDHPDKEALGIAGNPPERSMYETLLRTSRLHRRQGEAYAFLAPDAKADQAVRDVWMAIDCFLTGAEDARRSVSGLFALLRNRPFGLKDGVLPVLLAAALVHGQSQVALYEEGSFVPRPTAAVFERMFRYPEKYELQRFRVAGPRSEAFQRYAALVSKPGGERPDVLGVVRPLVRVVKDLPEYVSKTRRISETAQRVLQAMKAARQPDRLLFADLPVACGIPALPASGETDAGQLEGYFSRLRSAFAEIQRAYPDLLADIQRLVLAAFRQEGSLLEARKTIEHDARYVLNIAVDQKLKAFLMRVADASVEDATWVESVATLLAGKPPTHWDDQDRARFEVSLASSARTFDHFRTLAYEMERRGAALLDGDPRMLRISVTAPHAAEMERVVQVPHDLQATAARAEEEMLRVLREGGLLGRGDAGLAVLAEVARRLLSEGKPEAGSNRH